MLESVRIQKNFKTIEDYLRLGIPTTEEQALYNKYIFSIDNVATVLLKKSKEIGEVFIVTNAMKGWVEESARFYLPNTSSELSGIRILSARTTFQPKYPEFITENFKLWKYMMFQDIITNNKYKTIYSVGDSDAEFNAMMDIMKENRTLNISIIKFKFEPPTIQYLKLEIEKCINMVSNLKNNSIIYMENELNKPIEGFIQSGGNYLLQNYKKIIWFNHCY